MQDLFPFLIGFLYITLGVIGLLLNTTTCIMIWTKRVYRLSAYTLMANVAFSDSIMMFIAGIGCGFNTILYAKTGSNLAFESDFGKALNDPFWPQSSIVESNPNDDLFKLVFSTLNYTNASSRRSRSGGYWLDTTFNKISSIEENTYKNSYPKMQTKRLNSSTKRKLLYMNDIYYPKKNTNKKTRLKRDNGLWIGESYIDEKKKKKKYYAYFIF